ncbi:nif11-like leader peptide domain-containing protein [Roseovarius lutimaris]|uniref:Nif11-like leader peptide domain-containing protein n=1 Tax=Roseovarius lutimaris TaxID=1005928 RepID=A0A1I5FC52_9RHOB|nr:Nif11-like leader peptide family RiPP precursor [Roseovarius lutimaris]SFO21196.1 nif11-like leader peptide domain-containing protein [Roseovarius lutimaris]
MTQITQDQLSSFIDAVKANPALKQNLVGTDTLDSVVVAAKQMGFDFSADDLVKKAQMEVSEWELEGCCASTGTVKTGISLCKDCE